jgi:hypothetical protein
MDKTKTPLILVAAGISALLNFGLIAAAVFYDPRRPPSLLSRVVDMLTTPPGVIVGWLFTASHSGAGIFLALSCSLVFYTLIIWLILQAISWLRR